MVKHTHFHLLVTKINFMCQNEMIINSAVVKYQELAEPGKAMFGTVRSPILCALINILKAQENWLS